jgi:hypothetical protein
MSLLLLLIKRDTAEAEGAQFSSAFSSAFRIS